MNQTSQNGEIHRADPAYRRRMQAWLGAIGAAGATGLLALNLWLERLNATLSRVNVDAYQLWIGRLLAGMCLLLGLGMAVFGLWLHRMALQSGRERRWPPSAMKTSTDIRIRYLTTTDSFVQQLQAAAWTLWFLTLVLFAWAGWLLLAA